ncbi:MAG: copper resistance protein CopC [Candidatus Methylomirabilis oxyfera]|nr:copper resistance protein CopC [Candidatus Methylomirabilis oxyfera]
MNHGSGWLRRGRAALMLGLLLVTTSAWGHAFPDHSEPRVGWTVPTPPPRVRIWFDGALEPVFSTITVMNANSERVDKGDGRVNPSDSTILEVSLPPLPSGRYRVFWSVVARDGHRTEGDFPFTIEAPR